MDLERHLGEFAALGRRDWSKINTDMSSNATDHHASGAGMTAAPVPALAGPLPRSSFNEVGPARILVVAISRPTFQMLGAVLGHWGHEIIPAADGVTALKRVALRRPDLILLDLLMPGMDGCEVCHRLKGQSRLEGHSGHFPFRRRQQGPHRPRARRRRRGITSPSRLTRLNLFRVCGRNWR